MSGVEARVLAYLRECRPLSVVTEEVIAAALNVGDLLDIAAALYMLQASGEVRKMPMDGGHGWMLLS